MERLTTGIDSLDTLLQGGLIRGGLYMVMGRPGCGKTTLGNQVCFHHARRGGKTLYITLLAESHGRLLAHLEGFRFFDADVVGERLLYLSAYSDLERAGLTGLLELLRATVRRNQASLLVIDGVPTAGAIAPSEVELKKFVHELQVVVELMGCTCILLTGANHPDAHYAERTMVDGLILLSMAQVGMRMVREVEIVKHRGSAQLTGRHAYEIDRDGVVIHPRLEALGLPPRGARSAERVPTGVPGLDRLVGGGLRRGSVTLIEGPAGSGKTLLGASFLASDERGLYLGFREGVEDLLAQADAAGIPLGAAARAERVTLRCPIEPEALADSIAADLLARLRAQAVRRLVIDGLGGLVATLSPPRMGPFLAALFHRLRALDVTTLVTMEARGLASDCGVSALVDDVLSLRVVEVGTDGHVLVSATKTGAGGRSLRELHITDKGVIVDESPEGAARLLGSVERPS